MNELSPEELLKILASRRKGRRIRAVDMHDPFVCSSSVDWRDVLARKPPPPDRLRFEIAVRVQGLPFILRANDSWVAIEVKGNFAEPRFSINRPNMMLDVSRLSPGSTTFSSWPVYVASHEATPVVLKNPAAWELIEDIQLTEREGLHVYSNGVATYVQPGTIERLDGLLISLAKLIRFLPIAGPTEIDLTDLPERFRPLIPLIRGWARSDDLERETKIQRASRDRLKALVRRVEPELHAINAYLGGFKAVPPECATALGTLAEFAVEAKLYLTRATRARSRRPKP